MESQYQRSVPLEVRRAEGERVRAKHPDKIPVSSVWREEDTRVKECMVDDERLDTFLFIHTVMSFYVHF